VLAVAVLSGCAFPHPAPRTLGTVDDLPLYAIIGYPRSGTFVLDPLWVGKEKIVVRSGVLASSPQWIRYGQEHALRFNCFTFFEDDSHEGRGTLSFRECDNTLCDLCRHRDRLPGDEQVLACHGRSELKGLLGAGEGLEVWGPPEELHTSETWRFFTLKDASTVETMSVYCYFTHRPGTTDWSIDGLSIARGKAASAR